MKNKVFVYGTLLWRDRQEAVMGRADETRNATLKGYERKGLNIIENQDSNVDGLILHVTDEELSKLDDYEGLSHGLYRRMTVNVHPHGDVYAYQLTRTR